MGPQCSFRFIGHTGQKDWIGVELEDFYVIVPGPGKTVVMFRRPSEPQFKLVPKDIALWTIWKLYSGFRMGQS